jgi:ADP-heptose:LPS heptosyltransferase
VVLTGTEEEHELAASIAARMRAPAVNLAGQTGLGSFAALLSRARLVVCNDTGASHVADALCVPSAVLFTGSDSLRWSPQDRELHRVIVGAAAAPVETVLAEVDALLEESWTHAG